jgi:phenylalanyl-tRNA synthetase beta chain
MRDLGFDEVVGWSFTDPEEAARLRIPAGDARADAVVLSNPLSEEQSVMRTTLLGSLLDAAGRNLAHGLDRVALFESGHVYLSEPPAAAPTAPEAAGPLAGEFIGERPAPDREPHRLGCLAVGPLAGTSWRGSGEGVDFFALKGVLEGLAARLGSRLAFEAHSQPFLHPGRAARVLCGGDPAGWIGELHPLVCREWDIEAAVGFEAELAALVAHSSVGEETFEDVTTFPAVRQDIAVVVPDEVSAAAVRDAVVEGGGELLAGAEVFDLYQGEQLGEGRKSLALRLEFRAADRTLTDEEVAGLRERIAGRLKEIGGTLRE